MNPPVFIISGSSGSGKTTSLKNLWQALQADHITVGGLLAEGTWKNGQRDTFDLVDLGGGDRVRYCQREPEKSWEQIGSFYIHPRGQAFGESALAIDKLRTKQVVILDEIGPFELQGRGWSKPLEEILKTLDVPLVISVRASLVIEVVEYWSLNVIDCVDAKSQESLQLLEKIKSFVSESSS